MTDLQTIPLRTIAGAPTSLAAYAGMVALVVNTASRCGLTPQYAALQALYAKYREDGFVVLGFPANDFAGQEPGSDEEIAAFCATHYAVDFPMFAKIAVTGAARHPLYAALLAAQPRVEGAAAASPEISWNFEKFLIGRDGAVVARFDPRVVPDDDRIVTAIERELHAGE